jgi:hypothetical protein
MVDRSKLVSEFHDRQSTWSKGKARGFVGLPQNTKSELAQEKPVPKHSEAGNAKSIAWSA